MNIASLSSLYQNGSLPELEKLRRTSLKAFEEKGLPAANDEAWHYTDPSILLSRRWTSTEHAGRPDRALLQSVLDDSMINLVFYQGRFIAEFSQTEKVPGLIIAHPGTDAEDTLPLFGRNLADASSLEHLAIALAASGLYIASEKDAQIAKTVNVIYIGGKADEENLSSWRLWCETFENSSLSIILSFISEKDTAHLSTFHSLLKLHPSSNLDYTVCDLEDIKGGHLGFHRAEVAAGASLENRCLALGSRLGRHEMHADLTGEGASIQSDGAAACRGEREVSHYLLVRHLAPRTKSSQLFKNILEGESHSVFNAKVHITRSAPGSSAVQLNKNLLLGVKAHADARPQLEIDVDDVKASHGSTCGRLNEDELFYFESRGISRSKAEQMLSRGFLNEVTHRARREDVRRRLKSLLDRMFFHLAGAGDE